MTAAALRADAPFVVDGRCVVAVGTTANRPDLVLAFLDAHGRRVRVTEVSSYLEGELGVRLASRGFGR